MPDLKYTLLKNNPNRLTPCDITKPYYTDNLVLTVRNGSYVSVLSGKLVMNFVSENAINIKNLNENSNKLYVSETSNIIFELYPECRSCQFIINDDEIKQNWIQTYTGKDIDIFDVVYEDLDIIDIAHSLSLICRFVGHCEKFYSVADHANRVSDLAGEIAFNSFW